MWRCHCAGFRCYAIRTITSTRRITRWKNNRETVVIKARTNFIFFYRHLPFYIFSSFLDNFRWVFAVSLAYMRICFAWIWTRISLNQSSQKNRSLLSYICALKMNSKRLLSRDALRSTYYENCTTARLSMYLSIETCLWHDWPKIVRTEHPCSNVDRFESLEKCTTHAISIKNAFRYLVNLGHGAFVHGRRAFVRVYKSLWSVFFSSSTQVLDLVLLHFYAVVFWGSLP